jgi:hypothetical protein
MLNTDPVSTASEVRVIEKGPAMIGLASWTAIFMGAMSRAQLSLRSLKFSPKLLMGSSN